jgi:hypothetical protein
MAFIEYLPVGIAGIAVALRLAMFRRGLTTAQQ